MTDRPRPQGWPDDAEPLAPGIYTTPDGTLHLDAQEICEHLGVPRERQDELLDHLRPMLAEMLPDAALEVITAQLASNVRIGVEADDPVTQLAGDAADMVLESARERDLDLRHVFVLVAVGAPAPDDPHKTDAGIAALRDNGKTEPTPGWMVEHLLRTAQYVAAAGGMNMGIIPVGLDDPPGAKFPPADDDGGGADDA